MDNIELHVGHRYTRFPASDLPNELLPRTESTLHLQPACRTTVTKIDTAYSARSSSKFEGWITATVVFIGQAAIKASYPTSCNVYRDISIVGHGGKKMETLKRNCCM
jgi:hypothetical protein